MCRPIIYKDNNTKGLVVFASLLLATMCNAQRPMYAGSRPGGLSQKDKYLPTPNTTAEVGNRFGAAQDPAANTIPFGAEQQPPVGLPVVMPESSYQPLPPTFASTAGASAGGVATVNAEVGNRFGGNADGAVSPNQPIPLDAHGDRVLLEQLARLPVEKRPFWYLNYMAIEAQRNGTASSFGVPTNNRGSFAGGRSSFLG